MYKYVLSLTIFLTFLVLSCNNNSAKQSKLVVQENFKSSEKPLSDRNYALKKETPSIKWTAYKFSNKIGVSGSFDEITYNPSLSKGTIKQLFEHSTFSIETASINSNLKLRDERISTYFFSTIAAKTIKGSFLEVNNNKGKINIIIGKYSHVNDFTYTIFADKIQIHTIVNLKLWNALPGIIALNEICKNEHTGIDGVSKLWSDVTIIVEIALEPIQKK